MFSHSPPALLEWAPIVDEFKQLDEDIILNSMRFRCHEVMRESRLHLDAAAIVSAQLDNS